MSRGEQLYRQWSILQELRARRVSRRQLADTLGVSKRTISRDITALSMFPICEEHEGIDVFYSLVRGAKIPSVAFDAEEVAAVLLAESSVLAALEGSPYCEHVASAIKKIALLQRDASDRRLRNLPPVFHSSFAKPTSPGEIQQRLIDAATRRQLVEMNYWTAERDDAQVRTVEPYFVHLHPYGIHLIGFCRQRQDFLYFDLQCIREFAVLHETFVARDFDLHSFLETTFDGCRGTPVQDVHLRIRQPTAGRVRGQFFHASQKVTEVKGALEIRFRAGAPRAIAARVLSLGPDCEVIKPLCLRAEVAKKANEIHMLYVEDPISNNP